MLEVRDLCVGYGQHRALENVSVRVDAKEIVVILGANGAGKSTLLRTISGICEGQHSGAVEMDGHPILGLGSDEIVERGVALVPEGRGIFGDLTVMENLLLGAYSKRARADEKANLDRVLSLFPRLVERKSQIARTMSGGEQQMVAIGRAMMSNPQILMLDEPSLGLSPLLCKELFQNLTEVRKTGIGILLVEQNAKQSLAIADRGYLLENAHVIHEDSAEKLANDPAVQKAYLGAGAKAASVPVSEAPQEHAGEKPFVDAVANRPITAVPPVRSTADQLLGSSVDELVASASRQSREHQQPVPTDLGRAGHDERLKATLREIEKFAADARKPRLRTRVETPAPGNPAAKRKKAVKPVVVEVYRAPRVEIWRRRGDDGAFKRD